MFVSKHFFDSFCIFIDFIIRDCYSEIIALIGPPGRKPQLKNLVQFNSCLGYGILQLIKIKIIELLYFLEVIESIIGHIYDPLRMTNARIINFLAFPWLFFKSDAQLQYQLLIFRSLVHGVLCNKYEILIDDNAGFQINRKQQWDNIINKEMEYQAGGDNRMNQQVQIQKQVPNNIYMKQQSTNNCEKPTQQILKCLNSLASISYADTHMIRKAQQQLSKLSYNPHFIHHLLSIPLIQGISYDLAKLAITYSKTYTKNIINQHKSTQLVQCAQAIIEQLASPKLYYKLKQELAQTLVLILQKQNYKNLLLSCEQQLIQLLNSALYEQDINHINFQYLALLSYAILQTIPMPFVNHIQFLESAFVNIVKVAQILCKLLPVIGEKSIALEKQNDNLERALTLMSKYIQIIKKWIRKLKMANNKVIHLIDNNNIIELINNSLNFNLPNNSQSFPIFYISTTNSPNTFNLKTLSYFHEIKWRTIGILTLCTKVLLTEKTGIKQQLTNKFKLVKQGEKLAIGLISSVKNILKSHEYNQLQSRAQIQVIEQIYQYLIVIINSNIFYKTVENEKFNIIYGMIFKTLMFTEQDYENFIQQPEQFLNSVNQIFHYEQLALLSYNKTSNSPKRTNNNQHYRSLNRKQMNKSAMEMEEKVQEIIEIEYQKQKQQIEQFENLKTISARLLLSYIQNIDGSLGQLVMFCLNILDSRTNQTIYKKDLILLVLAIIKLCTCNHDNLKFKIGQVLIIMIRLRQIPKKFKKHDNIEYSANWQSIQYSMILITLQRYLPLIYEFIDQICQSLLSIISQIIFKEDVEEINKLIAGEFLPKILTTEQGSINSDKIIQLLINTLQPNTINIKYFDCLELIIQENGSELVGELPVVAKLINWVVNMLIFYIKNENMEGVHEQANRSTIIYKLWHIIQQIIINKYLMPQIAPYIYQSLPAILKLVNVASSNNQLILEQQLFKMVTIMVKKLQGITQFELQILEMCRGKFYNGSQDNKYSLTIMYQVIQNIIYFGTNILNTQINFHHVKYLLEMSVYSIAQQSVGNLPRSESQCLEGVYLMQSLIIGYGKMFDKSMWSVIMQCLRIKIKQGKVTYDFLRAGLVTNIALIIVFAYNFFDRAELSQILGDILMTNYFFTYKESGKIYTIALIEMLPLIQIEFIKEKFPKLLQIVLGMLQIIYHKKDSVLDGQDLDSEQIQYMKLKQQTINTLNYIDQFQLFKNQIQKIKRQSGQLFQFLYSSVSESKKTYMKQILSVRKINNCPRIIYKLKPKA